MSAAYLSLVLHAHLPYVRRPGAAASFEERWLFEAVIQCYLPLLRVFEGLLRDGVRARFAMSISPTLAEMLDDALLMDRCARHLAALSDLAAREVGRTRADARLHRLALAHRDEFGALAADFESRGRRLLPAFAALRDAGMLDLATTAATHGHLPLLNEVPPAARAQIRIGAAVHRRVFGAAPGGFWPPELAYQPGLEREFAAVGARWFCVETHGLLHADIRPHYGTFAPVACPNGVAAFARDPETARRVWDAREGYPGDAWYREYHRDIGFELAPEDLGSLAAPPGTRGPTGIKYHRVTGRVEDKRLYEPARAAATAREHAADFVRRVATRAAAAAPAMDRPPHICAPFDAELFGHWWHEGPVWLGEVARLAAGSGAVELLTPSDYLERHPRLQRATPAESSWGAGGGHETWLNESTAWIWPQLHDAARRMEGMARAVPHARCPGPGRASGITVSGITVSGVGCQVSGRTPTFGRRLSVLGSRPSALGPRPSDLGPPAPSSLRDRAVRQAARCLLLAQASDWAFMIRNDRAADFAARMVRDRLSEFDYLEDAVRRDRADPRRLASIERAVPLFAALDPGVFLD